MDAKWVCIGAVNGLLAVAAGAFGAHFLKNRLSAGDLAAFEVAARYQMYHALALLGVAALAHARPSSTTSASGACMLSGIVLFSGSLYGLTLGGWKWLGPITPIGGLLLIVGWLLLAVGAFGAARGPLSP
jgi:uncharacterized membrane protein YgdD (TMEM256/DUF423 family)